HSEDSHVYVVHWIYFLTFGIYQQPDAGICPISGIFASILPPPWSIVTRRSRRRAQVTLRNIFTDHPSAVGETYWQHLGAALGFSGRLMAASLACLVHALLPFLFVKTGSRAIMALHEHMVVSRQRPPGDAAPGAAERRAA